MQLLVRILPFFVVFTFFFLPSIDTDLGWHLRYGEHFLTTGGFLTKNEFTYLQSDYIWANYYNLYQILVALIFRAGGFWGLSITYALLLTITYFFFSKLNPKLKNFNLLTFGVITLTSWHVFSLGLRAQIFSFAFFVAILYLLKKVEERPKVAWVFPVIFLFWGNIHGGFILGLIILAFAAIWKFVVEGWERSRYLTFAATASFLTPLFNPFGLGLYQEVFKHLYYPLKDLIAEWVPLSAELQIIAVFVALIFLWLIIASRVRGKIFWIFAIALFTVLTFQARRNVPFLALVIALSFLEIFKLKLESLESQLPFRKFAPLLLIGIIIGVSVFSIPKTYGLNTQWGRYCSEGLVKYPCKAVEFIKQNNLQGKNIFNAYEWGGFLEWQLPQYKYFVDGRMPAWPTKEGKSPYTFYLENIQAQKDYQKRLDEYKTDILLIGSGTFLDLELQKGKNLSWKEIYRDDVSVVYTKR